MSYGFDQTHLPLLHHHLPKTDHHPSHVEPSHSAGHSRASSDATVTSLVERANTATNLNETQLQHYVSLIEAHGHPR
jgi:hypothetical protein